MTWADKIEDALHIPHEGSSMSETPGEPAPAETAEEATDPRDARIAELEAEVASLKAGGAPATAATDMVDVEARIAELEGQGLSAEDAAEQASYEARVRADHSPPPVNVTV